MPCPVCDSCAGPCHRPQQCDRLNTLSNTQGDCGRVMVVLLTDGRANVSLAKSNDDPDAIGPDAVKPTTVRPSTGLAELCIMPGS